MATFVITLLLVAMAACCAGIAWTLAEGRIGGGRRFGIAAAVLLALAAWGCADMVGAQNIDPGIELIWDPLGNGGRGWHHRTEHHHPLHMDFYRGWKEPGSSASCCNARVEKDGREVGDCEPTEGEVRRGADGVVRWHAWLRQERRWIEVPDTRVLRERNPNVADAHLCWTPTRGVICFVPPDTGG